MTTAGPGERKTPEHETPEHEALDRETPELEAPNHEAPELEALIARWRARLEQQPAVDATDLDELEGHLRDRIADLGEAGLAPDEAFLIAVKRMGSVDDLSSEFAQEHSERLWKRLAPEPAAEPATHGFLVMIGFACLAAAAVKVPEIFGASLVDDGEFYARNLSLFALVPLAGYFVWRRGLPAARALRLLAAPFIAAAVVVNVYPFEDGSDTEVLAVLHLPIALWLLVGVAYAGGDWRSSRRRMDYVRFSGEWFVYYVLIALGGGVLASLTQVAFSAIGIDAGEFVSSWVLACGALGAVVVASWLVEAKQSVIENMAPVLTRLFTPLFAAMLVALLGAMVWTRRGIDFDRDILIVFDLVLALVLGLLLYAISARDPRQPYGPFDLLQLVLVVSALVADAVMLAAVASRVSDLGLTPNRVAALGENVVLLANLSVSAWLYLGFARGRRPIASLERWQTAYAPVYAVWAAVVVVAFPPLFGFA
ncbi:MAG: permease prefix domain 1-containing protein [Acidimicrobiaceae bacterium]|nr:permease prefix domain 1-containing protein [Acidimicrobiaceae bacterium]